MGERRSIHPVSCGRRLARDVTDKGGTAWDAVLAIHGHCGVSLLRAHRVAHGMTLVEVASHVSAILRRDGIDSSVAHQSISRWEKQLDLPSHHYLDALCQLYRTRTDRLGFGADYTREDDSAGNGPGPNPDPDPARPSPSNGDPLPWPANPAAQGGPTVSLPPFPPSPLAQATPRQNRAAASAVRNLEERTARSGYYINVLPPSEFVEARMHDLAQVYGLLRTVRSDDSRQRLHRVEAKNAGFIAGRLGDVAELEEALGWFRLAQRAARQSGDASLEAWVCGYLSYVHVCFRRSLDKGLGAARAAQSLAGPRPSPARVLGLLVEAGVQARRGLRRETLDALREAETVRDRLPSSATEADGIGASEYRLRWHQAHNLGVLGEHRIAAELRRRALELPQAGPDLVGRAMLELDEAMMLLRRGEVEHGCTRIRQIWRSLPAEYRPGLVTRRITQIMGELPAAQRMLLAG